MTIFLCPVVNQLLHSLLKKYSRMKKKNIMVGECSFRASYDNEYFFNFMS